METCGNIWVKILNLAYFHTISVFLDPPMVGLTMLYAKQAVEAEVLIALKRVKGRCVLVGDPCQLPATVFQRPGL